MRGMGLNQYLKEKKKDLVRAILDLTKTVNLDSICWIWAGLAVLTAK